MAQKSFVPEYIGPESETVTVKPTPVNEPVNLMQKTNGFVSVKMFFTDRAAIPRGLRMAPKRDDTFPVVNQIRQDDGILAFEYRNVSAELLRHGIANTDGHAWGLINAVWWEQPITAAWARKKYGPTQYVVMLTYCEHPNIERTPEDKEVNDGSNLLMTLERQTEDDLRVLARSVCWGALTVWNNEIHGDRLTINLRAPKPVDITPAERVIVVRKGCLDVIPVAER